MKTDCNISENYLNELRRMCSWAGDCRKCDAVDLCISEDPSPAAMIAATQKWSDEHPEKLTIEKALETLSDKNSDESMVTHGHVRKALLLALSEIDELKRRPEAKSTESKTYLEDLKEKYPNVDSDIDNLPCPSILGLKDMCGCSDISGFQHETTCEDCWNQQI